MEPQALPMGVVRAADIESSLADAIRRFQAVEELGSAPPLSALACMTAPTQIYGVAVELSGTRVTVLAVVHRDDRPNADVQVFLVGAAAQLGWLADQLDACVPLAATAIVADGGPPYVRQGLLSWCAVNLHRAIPRIGPPEAGSTSVRWMQATGGVTPGRPMDAWWTASIAAPVPSGDEFFRMLLKTYPREKSNIGGALESSGGSATAGDSTPTPVKITRRALGGCLAPRLSLGEPKIPSAQDRLSGVWMVEPRGIEVYRTTVGDLQMRAFDRGLVICETTDRVAACEALNLLAGAFQRSGVFLAEFRDTDLMDWHWEEDELGVWTTWGSGGSASPRNLPAVPLTPLVSPHRDMLVIPLPVLADAFQEADRSATESHRRTMALRLATAAQVLESGHPTVAFVVAWFVVETEAFHQHGCGTAPTDAAAGPKSRHQERSVQHALAALLARGTLAERLHARLDAFRRRRNAIVHRQGDATHEEAAECIAVATSFVGLGAVDTSACWSFLL